VTEPPVPASGGLRLEGVRAGYGGREVLHGIDLEVAAGELLVVLGPSGSGKSTLLRVVAGLEPVTGGRVHLAGRDVTTLRPGRRNVSMVFQTYALFPHLNVLDNITFGLEVRDTKRSAAREAAREAARAAGCADLLDRRPGQLSGGERQRVALARALVRRPDAFLLDEPLSNLDAELRVHTRAELRALHDRVGGTTVHVTHDQVEALTLGDRVAVLVDGRLEQVGTPEQLWLEPATWFVARFVGSPAMNRLGTTSPLRPSRPAGTGGDKVVVGVRPDAVLLEGKGKVTGTVLGVEIAGADAHVRLEVNGDELVARVPLARRPAVSDRVSIVVDPESVHVFDAATGARVRR
jgi:ABC-type sugar transport system ATPase subunit